LFNGNRNDRTTTFSATRHALWALNTGKRFYSQGSAPDHAVWPYNSSQDPQLDLRRRRKRKGKGNERVVKERK